MSIIRSPRPDSHFAIYSNDIIRDGRLSYKARGILLELLSRPDNWTVSAEALAKSGVDGRDSILSGLNELRALGYIVTTKKRKENGQFETVSMVYDVPTTGFPTSVKPTSVKPKQGNPKLEKPDSIEEPIKKKREEEPNKEELIKNISSNELDRLFEIFWNTYPRKVGKDAAKKAFAGALKRADYFEIIQGVQRYQSDPNRLPEFTAHPSTWLNAGRWTDDPLPKRGKQNGFDVATGMLLEMTPVGIMGELG